MRWSPPSPAFRRDTEPPPPPPPPPPPLFTMARIKFAACYASELGKPGATVSSTVCAGDACFGGRSVIQTAEWCPTDPLRWRRLWNRLPLHGRGWCLSEMHRRVSCSAACKMAPPASTTPLKETLRRPTRRERHRMRQAARRRLRRSVTVCARAGSDCFDEWPVPQCPTFRPSCLIVLSWFIIFPNRPHAFAP